MFSLWTGRANRVGVTGEKEGWSVTRTHFDFIILHRSREQEQENAQLAKLPAYIPSSGWNGKQSSSSGALKSVKCGTLTMTASVWWQCEREQIACACRSRERARWQSRPGQTNDHSAHTHTLTLRVKCWRTTDPLSRSACGGSRCLDTERITWLRGVKMLRRWNVYACVCVGGCVCVCAEFRFLQRHRALVELSDESIHGHPI